MWFRLVALFFRRRVSRRGCRIKRIRWWRPLCLVGRASGIEYTMGAICARVLALSSSSSSVDWCGLMTRSIGAELRHCWWLVPWPITDINRERVVGRTADLRPSISLMRRRGSCFSSRLVYGHRSGCAALLACLPINGLITSGSRQPVNGRRNIRIMHASTTEMNELLCSEF